MDYCTNLKELLTNVPYRKVNGSLDREISGLTHDSRKCHNGYIFFAICGIHFNGHDFIDAAITNGTAVVVHSSPLSFFQDDITYIQTDSVYESISRISAAFYNNPSHSLKVIGVTGTDGKTSTCDFIYQLLTCTNKTAALLSSVWQDNGTGRTRNLRHMTTPDAIEIQKFLHEAVINGCEYAVVEASSHGLSDHFRRLEDVCFTISICTGITSDHMDFHKTQTSYIDAKMTLFRLLKGKNRLAIIPADAEWNDKVLDIVGHSKKIHTWMVVEPGCELTRHASLVLSISEINNTGMNIMLCFRDTQYQIKVPFLFPVQARNLAPALLTLFLVTDETSSLVMKCPENLESIPRRFNLLEPPGQARILIDFAHTAHAFSTIFSNAALIYPGKKFITVFGSAGCRDTSKRALMGRIASRHCDIIILTDEDPREEDSLIILQDIRAGIPKNYQGTIILQPDRRKALKTALQLARFDDIIFCLGKGHETSIEKSGKIYPWNEKKVILELIQSQGDGLDE